MPSEIKPGEIIMVTYDQQSVDMSLYAAGVLLANKGTTESKVVQDYNGKNPDYADEIGFRLACLQSKFADE